MKRRRTSANFGNIRKRSNLCQEGTAVEYRIFVRIGEIIINYLSVLIRGYMLISAFFALT